MQCRLLAQFKTNHYSIKFDNYLRCDIQTVYANTIIILGLAGITNFSTSGWIKITLNFQNFLDTKHYLSFI